MANKTFQGRIVQKHDTKANWDKATNFIPLKGEIIIYDDLNKMKIGDGTTTVGNLTFSNDLDTLATIAKTGSYNDLTNKPDIPTIPTKVSAFENDKNYLTNESELNYKNIINDPYHLNPVSESECYYVASNNKVDAIKIDIANLPTFLLNQKGHYFYFDNQDVSSHYLLIYNGTTKIKQVFLPSIKYISIRTNTFDTNGNPDTIFIQVVTNTGIGNTGYSYTISTGVWQAYLYLDNALSKYAKTADLATVATSGDYTDLTNKPTIPTKLSDLTDDVVDGKYLPLTGGTLTGSLTLPSGDLSFNDAIKLSGGISSNIPRLTITSALPNHYTVIHGVDQPEGENDAANKKYVDFQVASHSTTIVTWSDDRT